MWLNHERLLPGTNDTVGAERWFSFSSDLNHSGLVLWQPQNTKSTFRILIHDNTKIILSQKWFKWNILSTCAHYIFAFKTVIFVKVLHFFHLQGHISWIINSLSIASSEDMINHLQTTLHFNIDNLNTSSSCYQSKFHYNMIFLFLNDKCFTLWFLFQRFYCSTYVDTIAKSLHYILYISSL